MNRIIRLSCLVTACLIGFGAPASAYSTLPEAVVTRSIQPATAKVGDTVQVTITARIGAIGADPMRGFFLSDHVPSGFTVSAVTVTVDGSPIEVTTNTSEADAVYPGYTTTRWVLEAPPGWSENHPLPAESTLVIAYQVEVPAGTAAGDVSFPGLMWVGMIAAQDVTGDHFGYEDEPALLQITGNGDPDPDPDPNGNGDVGGGCEVAHRGGAGAGLLCLALVALALGRRRIRV